MSGLADWPHLHRAGLADAPVLLLLHGTGGSEHDIATLAEHLDPRATVLAPRGRVLEQGMTRWFRRLAEGVFDVDDVERRAGELAEFIDSAVAEYGLAGRPLIAAGFSNGANIALATALLHPDRVSRVVAFSGMYPLGDREPEASTALDGVAVLLANGASDPMAPAASVDRLERVLRAGGADVSRHTRPGGHGLAHDDLAAAREWLATHG